MLEEGNLEDLGGGMVTMATFMTNHDKDHDDDDDNDNDEQDILVPPMPFRNSKQSRY